MSEIKLTQFSHGSGCGCKISPKILDQILHTNVVQSAFPSLLVGNKDKDDAAVFDLGNGEAIISTTDFFMPIVDDAFDFGRIASTNALSDIYAMGGEPMMAIAILGWPVDTIPAEIAQQVLDGSRATCAAANIPLAGGHSIDSPEILFLYPLKLVYVCILACPFARASMIFSLPLTSLPLTSITLLNIVFFE